MGVVFLSSKLTLVIHFGPKSIGLFLQLRSLIKKKLGLCPLIKVKILRQKHTYTHTNDKTKGAWMEIHQKL